MEFRVLGPLELVHHGRVVPVGGNRERAILARLVLSANQVVSVDRLAEDLWCGAPPEGAAQALWVYVSRLRKALRSHGGDEALLTRPPGYVLRVDPEDVDATRFEALVERGRQLAAESDPGGAASKFREALALWRGPALADVADAPFARAEAARLEEAHLSALEERIEADLACGRHGELVGELAGLTREHPLREHLWAQRMLALYRAGRQAEALRAYQDLRRYLGEELGIEPGEALRRLETAMLRHEPDLDWQPPERTGGPALGPPVADAGDAAVPAGGVVSFLFTDVVGSTELLERLGDEVADELRRRHFTLLREALATHGGEEVKSLGDGLMAAFPSPLGALRGAVAIQQAVAEEGGGSGPALAVRVGLHAGEPITDEDDFFGTPVVVAQRLCARARGGQILASALVQGLVGNRGGCSFKPLGGLVLKGLAEPVAACEVLWEQPPEMARPLPLPLERASSAFVGREEEIARLEVAWEEARAGRRQLVLLAGEPGIGKTRLAAEVAGRAHAGGAVVLFGRCDEGMGVPFQPFVEALGTYIRQTRAPALGRFAGELARLVPWISEHVDGLPPPLGSDPETERYRLFDGVAAWLSAASAEVPAVLVIDDVHWATRPTLALLNHLVRSAEPLRLLMVASYRDTQLDVTGDLADAVAELLRQSGVDRVRLGGLDEAGVAALMEAQARHELDDAGRALATTVHAGTAGNPFFVTQVLRHLAETDAIVRRDGRWTPEGPLFETGIPEGVRDVIARRLARLPDETWETLALAAVIGDHFDLGVLVRAVGQPEISTLRALDPAIAARLVSEAGGATVGYRFVHALVRHTLYDALPRAQRIDLHRRAGQAIEAAHVAHLDDHLPALAHHFARAGADEREKAIDYATRVADRALAQRAHDEAAGYYRQALELLEAAEGPADEARRLELFLSLGEAQRRAGDSAHRETLFAAARLAQERGDTDALARAALANARTFLYNRALAVDAERVAGLETALRLLGNVGTGTCARLMATLGIELTFAGQRDRRVGLSEEALRIARRQGDPDTLAHVLMARVPTIWDPNTLSERLADTAELLEVAACLDDPMTTARAHWLRFRMTMEAGQVDEADRHLELAEALAGELGQPTLTWMVTWSRGGRALLAGRLSDAERRFEEALDLGQRSGQPDAGRYFAFQQFQVRFEQGRLGDVAVSFADVYADLPAPMVGAFLALLYCEVGDNESARRLLDGVAGASFRDLAVDSSWHVTLMICASVASQLGDTARALTLYELLRPYPDQLSISGGITVGCTAHYLGLLATALRLFDEAEASFAAAADIHARIGAPTWLARTRLGSARMLLARRRPGDAERARGLAREALAAAEELGAARLADQARALLGSARGARTEAADGEDL